MKWFNRLDTMRRLFFLGIFVFYAIFLYLKGPDMIYFVDLSPFNHDSFNFALQQYMDANGISDWALGYASFVSPGIAAFEQFGLSILITAALCYAVFRKQSAD